MKKSKEIDYFKSGQKKLKAWRPTAFHNFPHEAQVIDLFCGSGGMSLGFAALAKAEGYFKLIGGADINEVSLKTYNHNFGVPAIKIDVREIAKSRKNLKSFLNQLDGFDPTKKIILIGCAPCQGFTAHRKKDWDTPDVRNGLVEAFADIAYMMEPDCIIMENVPELLSGKYWHHFEYVRDRLKSKNYVVKQAIHNSAAQGVPQERFRAVVMAMKTDFSLPSEKLSRNEFKTVKDAFTNLAVVSAGEQCAKDLMHKSATHRKTTIDVIRAIPIDGGSRPDGIGPKCLQNFKGYADVYGRLAWSKPSITITHYARNPASGRFVHPEQHRGLTMREAARLQSFPDGYEFKGGFDDVFRQIGEAVPPLLSLAVAASALANIRGESEVSDAHVVEGPVNNSYSGVIVGLKSNRK